MRQGGDFTCGGQVKKSNMWARESLLVFAVLLSNCTMGVASSTSDRFTFSVTSQCVDNHCFSLFYTKARSRTECAAMCGFSSTCVGFIYVLLGDCVHVKENCSLNSSCADFLSVYSKHISKQPCFNKGTWNPQRLACSCINGWVGDRCERKAYRCEELYTFGYGVGTHTVDIDVYKNQSLVSPTQCEVGSNYWRTFLFSSDARGDYNRTWAEYQGGFEDGPWNKWLGLRNMYAFNQMGHVTLTFSVVVQNGGFVWEFVYENFLMSDATSGYEFTYSHSFNRTFGNYYLNPDNYLGDVLGLTQGRPFSTSDRDQDNDSKNCAALQGAGWWIDSCTREQTVNPLGLNPKWAASVSEFNQLCIPGLNISEQSIMDNFQSVFMTFTD